MLCRSCVKTMLRFLFPDVIRNSLHISTRRAVSSRAVRNQRLGVDPRLSAAPLRTPARLAVFAGRLRRRRSQNRERVGAPFRLPSSSDMPLYVNGFVSLKFAAVSPRPTLALRRYLARSTSRFAQLFWINLQQGRWQDPFTD